MLSMRNICSHKLFLPIVFHYLNLSSRLVFMSLSLLSNLIRCVNSLNIDTCQSTWQNIRENCLIQLKLMFINRVNVFKFSNLERFFLWFSNIDSDDCFFFRKTTPKNGMGDKIIIVPSPINVFNVFRKCP